VARPRDRQLRSQDLTIAPDTLEATADRLLGTHGPEIRRLVAGLAMPDWPEGTRPRPPRSARR
jgi:hypothetical protein